MIAADLRPDIAPGRTRYLLAGALAVNLALTLHGITWALPDRWSFDEQVVYSLRLLASGSPLTVTNAVHPQLYNFFLALVFVPYLAYLRLSGAPLPAIRAAAEVSWNQLAHQFPGFATSLYLVARLSSVALGLLSLLLVFRIARSIRSRRAGVIAAAVLGVSMGFVSTNHLAKHTSLVVFLVLLVTDLAVTAYVTGRVRYLKAAAFCAGLAATAKLDGVISLLPICAAAYYLWRRPPPAGSDARGGPAGVAALAAPIALLFVAGLAVGWPVLFTGGLSQYLAGRSRGLGVYYGGFPPFNAEGAALVAGKVRDNFLHLFSVFGPPLGAIAIVSAARFAATAKISIPSRILLWLTLPYTALVLIYFTKYPGASVKLMIHLLPLLSIMVGVAFDRWRSRPATAALAVALVWGVVHTERSNRVFAGGDTRYQLTEWIERNVDRSASIEIAQEGDLFFASRILFEYDVTYLGRHSKTYQGALFQQTATLNEQTYRPILDRQGSRADYFMVASWTPGILENTIENTSHDSFLARLVRNQVPEYRLERVFTKPDSPYWTPVPEYTSPTMMVFRRTSPAS